MMPGVSTDSKVLESSDDSLSTSVERTPQAPGQGLDCDCEITLAVIGRQVGFLRAKSKRLNAVWLILDF